MRETSGNASHSSKEAIPRWQKLQGSESNAEAQVDKGRTASKENCWLKALERSVSFSGFRETEKPERKETGSRTRKERNLKRGRERIGGERDRNPKGGREKPTALHLDNCTKNDSMI